MSDDAIPDRTRLPIDVLDRIDQACDRFEAAWSRGERPRIEDAIGEVDAPYRRALLRDLLAAEIAARRRVGECPEPADYRDRTGLDALAVDSAFGAAGGDADATVERIPDDPTVSVHRPIAEGPGTTIGPYKLLQQIGEGGMGTVFMAEQEKPVRRKVALKVIKPGMDTAQVIARFEAERQALAMMDHPNIARVLDVGATETGRPYFVMELVKGVPITEYCDRNGLTPKERLELFMPVCQAIQHAHQKGIIHRDIKPSNVLVALHDGVPEPKVIDFGVAKAIQQRLTERTMFTEFGAIIGTLEYMSPEQAEMGALDIDTRSDIYSLGVLLYELLTGSTPLERAKLFRVAYSEILKRIREEDPPKPSTRLSESKDALPSISAQRRMEPARLTRLVRGDLDWIVMKSLEKDRTRRYETATGFARDIRRYLDGDAVEASPPSATYKLRKFARKYRRSLVTVGVFLGLLIASAALSTVLALRARRAEGNAKTQARLAGLEEQNAKRANAESRSVLNFFRGKVLAAARPLETKEGLGREVTLRAAIDAAEPKVATEFADQPDAEIEIRRTLGDTYHDLGEPAEAIRQYERARALYREKKDARPYDLIGIDGLIAQEYFAAGRTDEAVALFNKTLEMSRKHLGPDHHVTGNFLNSLALIHLRKYEWAEAIELLGQVRANFENDPTRDPIDLVSINNSLADAYRGAGRRQEALALSKKTLDDFQARFGPDDRHIVVASANLAVNLKEDGRTDEAIKLLEPILASREEILGQLHPTTLLVRSNLSSAYCDKGRFPEAVALLEKTLPAFRAKLGSRHLEVLTAGNNLAEAFMRVNRVDDALRLHQEVAEGRLAVLGPDNTETMISQRNLAQAHAVKGHLELATSMLEPLVKKQKTIPGLDESHRLHVMGSLAYCYKNLGRTDEAIPLYEQVLTGMRKKFGAAHTDTLAVQNNLATAYLQVKRAREATPLLDGVLKAFEARFPPRNMNVLAARNNLGQALDEVGRTGEAIAQFEIVVPAVKPILGPTHPNTLAAVNKLADIYSRVGRGAEAEALLRESLAACDKAKLTDWPTFATRNRLGSVLAARKKLVEAETMLVSGYDGLKAREKELPAIGRTYLDDAGKRVIDFYDATGKPDKAAEWRAKLGIARPELPRDVFVTPQ